MKTDREESSVNLTLSELNRSRLFLVYIHQNLNFNELKGLVKKGSIIPKNIFNPYIKLNPFYEGELLRVGGKLANSQLPNDNKHLLLLYDNDVLTRLLIDHAHQATAHGGTQLTL